MNHNTEDERLFASLQSGDKKAFNTFFLRYYPVLCAYATHFVGMDDAEEIIQDMMVGIWERRKDIAIESSLNGYLFRTVQNKCVNHIDRLRLHERVHSFLACNRQKLFEDPDFYVVEELTQKIEDALKKLPEKYREAFVLNRIEGKTYNEIAATLGVSSKTIDYRIRQALKCLRDELKDYLPLLLTLVGNKII
ncbi:RNA polymerase sigma-70 factor [Bacteroides heparinolyticus]|uniref:RNA polymerase sigma-70 factor n=1 Tax=Prevotella heparinolytica TaxID=28113 RepID=UPI0023F7A312|nr:RNA polymerase sigma-70 factor [Bacteroides heparinolyticus]MCI6213223.1 RNA polymerase sigma-70 factor [Bacteroides heparinolyticus]